MSRYIITISGGAAEYIFWGTLEGHIQNALTNAGWNVESVSGSAISDLECVSIGCSGIEIIANIDDQFSIDQIKSNLIRDLSDVFTVTGVTISKSIAPASFQAGISGGVTDAIVNSSGLSTGIIIAIAVGAFFLMQRK